MHQATAKAKTDPETEQDAVNTQSEDRYPTQEEIRARAFEIYLARNPEEGNEIDDWLQAEREIWEKT